MRKFFNKNKTEKKNIEEFCFVFTNASVISYALFNTIAKKNTIDFLRSSYSCKNDFFSRLSNKIKRNVPHIKLINLRKYKDKIVFMTNEALSVLSEKNFFKIRAVAKAVILFFIDEFFNDYESMKKAKEYFFKYRSAFDLVYTFSEKDAKKYNMRWTMEYYPLLNVGGNAIKFDLFFIGSLKDRQANLFGIQEILLSKEVDCHFIVGNNNKRLKELLNDSIEIKSMPYIDSIKYVISSNCILDLPDYRQEGMTLRYFEAVVYNKKLLTTNKNVKNTKYYNDKYMKIIENIEDVKNIDKDWFKSSEDINYNYNGEYEPALFLNSIINDLREESLSGEGDTL